MVINETAVDYTKIKFNTLPRPRGYHGQGGEYVDAIAAFDIETSRFPEVEQAAMYVWQFCIDFPDGSDLVIIGRTWRQFKHMLGMLQVQLKGRHLLIYIQNASYEFAFLSGVYPFRNDEVFCLESRSILYFSMYRFFDFRCSYKLFNMSLKEATAKYCPVYTKKSGEAYDYEQRRFSDTPLTRRELLYCVYDVWGLCKAVRAVMDLYHDTIYTIPYTTTGYVRREAKRVMRPNHKILKSMWPDFEVYQLLRVAFRGGNTHANRFYTNEILENVSCVDIASSYPTQQCTKLYPMTPFKKRIDMSSRAMERRMDNGEALLIHAILRNVKLRYKWEPVPYLPISKCMRFPVNVVNDNGRILSCDECEIACTDIDFKIIEQMYSFDLEMLDLYSSWYDHLPQELVTLNQEYFRGKTELKGVDGQELYYMKSKNLLNAIYGMSVMDPVKPLILFDGGLYNPSVEFSPPDLLKRAGKSPYVVYQWGVWTTAHARDDLQAGIRLCGDSLVYVDTDSCKYMGDADFSEYNQIRRERAINSGSYATDKHGTAHYMGVYEEDGVYKRFKTLGAKKYAYEIERKGKTELHITIAGVPKRTGAAELKAAGGLDAFQEGFIFSNTGKLEAVYNDGTLRNVEIDGRKMDFTNNIVLRPTTYKLDLTGEYGALVEKSAQYLNCVMEFYRKNGVEWNK